MVSAVYFSDEMLNLDVLMNFCLLFVLHKGGCISCFLETRINGSWSEEALFCVQMVVNW